MTITAALDITALATPSTHIADVDSIVSFRCHQRRNMVGEDFELTVAADASCLSDLTMGRLIRLKLNGTVAYVGVLVEIIEKEVEAGEAAAENVTYRGRPLCSVLDRIRVRSQFEPGKKPWSSSRSFNFGSREFDVSGWDSATVIVPSWDSPSDHWERGPSGFPDFAAAWIGPDDGTDTTAPLGDCYYVADPEDDGSGLFTLADDTGLTFFNGADNNGPLLFDGLSLLNIDQFDTTQFTATHNATAYGSTGTHRYAAKISNPTGLDDMQNPTGLIASCRETSGNGRLGDLVFLTDATFKILQRPGTPPGFAIGHITRIVVEENQDDGLLTNLTLGCTDTDDSNADAWDTYENVTLNVGDSVLKILTDFAQLYCTWDLSPTLELNLYRLDATPNASGVTYSLDADPEVSSLAMFERDTIDVGTDCLLMKWEDGYVRVPSSGGTRMDYLSTNATTEAEAVTVGTAALLQQNEPSQITTKIEPTGTGDVPGVDWVLGDTITLVPPSGSITEVVEEWSLTLTDYLDFEVTVGAVHLPDDVRLALWLQRMAGGASAGTAPAALGGTRPVFDSQASLRSVTFSAPDPLATGEATKNDSLTTAANLYALELTLKTAGTSTTTVEIWVNGSSVGSCSLASGEENAVAQIDDVVLWVLPTDVLTVNITAVGTDAAGLTVKPWFV